MDYYPISFSGNLTSYNFYNSILKQLHEYYKDDGRLPLVFDFRRVRSIDTLVVPNLLCVAYTVKKNSNHTPHFIVSDNIDSSSLKRYLNDIKFVQLAEQYDLFEFQSSIKGGWAEKGIQKLSSTMLFNGDEDERTSWNKLCSNTRLFTERYLSDFDYTDQNYSSENMIVRICHEIITNSKTHGHCFAFMSMQYSNYLGKVFISISDCGVGFKESYNAQIDKGNPYKLFINERVTDEMSGIIQGLFARSESKVYGLYHVFRKIIEHEGTVRIHSMNTQLILTPNLRIHFEIGDNKKSFESIMQSDKLKSNVRNDLKFQGVHIELEIPIIKKAAREDFSCFQ